MIDAHTVNHLNHPSDHLNHQQFLATAPPSRHPPLGLLNLGMVIILVANSRLIIENLLKYGIRFNPASYLRTALQPSGNHLLLAAWGMLGGFVVLAYSIELLGLTLLKHERRVRQPQHKGVWGEHCCCVDAAVYMLLCCCCCCCGGLHTSRERGLCVCIT